MTVNELIKTLNTMKKLGHGNKEIVFEAKDLNYLIGEGMLTHPDEKVLFVPHLNNVVMTHSAPL